MVDPYVGEIRTVGFNFAPQGWAMCNGQLIPIQQNTALFSLLGTNYGGDGKVTFALPNLNSSFVIGQGEGPGLTPRIIGEMGGTASVTLLSSEMPSHTHTANAVATPGNTGSPADRRWAETRYGRATRNAYSSSKNTTMAPDALAPSGGNSAHNNMPPYVGMYYVIALQGVFPPRD
ncbi:tail fiber protein [Microbacterium natoriense]|uniref:phage tail protein n=1 Tax=Microbacterium TaxID=33882 RepID=UPI0015E34D9C|nr:tail fiber protein [Microbacterium sp. MYb72]